MESKADVETKSIIVNNPCDDIEAIHSILQITQDVLDEIRNVTFTPPIFPSSSEESSDLKYSIPQMEGQSIDDELTLPFPDSLTRIAALKTQYVNVATTLVGMVQESPRKKTSELQKQRTKLYQELLLRKEGINTLEVELSALLSRIEVMQQLVL